MLLKTKDTIVSPFLLGPFVRSIIDNIKVIIEKSTINDPSIILIISLICTFVIDVIILTNIRHNNTTKNIKAILLSFENNRLSL